MIGEPSFERGPSPDRSEQEFLAAIDSQMEGLSQRIDTTKQWIAAGHGVAGEGEQAQVLEGYLADLKSFRDQIAAKPGNESLRTEAQHRMDEIQESLRKQGELGMAVDSAAIAKQEQIDLNRLLQQQREGEKDDEEI